MSGICSRHQEFEPGCPLCAFDPTGHPDFIRIEEEAKAAGTRFCFCGFEYFLTTDACPLCGRKA